MTRSFLCGSDNWGYRHILKRHLGDWEARASLAQEGWRGTADYGISWALKDPDHVVYRKPNDTFCYSRQILLVDKRTGKVVGRYYPNVSVARVNHNMITAYPASPPVQCLH